MTKYITEKTLRRYQLDTPDLEADEYRRSSLLLACVIAITYEEYSTMRHCSDTINNPSSVQEIEEKIDKVNSIMGTEISLSEVCESLSTCEDEGIDSYLNYKELLESIEGDSIKVDIIKKVNEELFEKYGDNYWRCIQYTYYAEVAILLLEYLCGEIDYNSFIHSIIDLKMFPNQKSINGSILKKMIRDSNKWSDRYYELYEEIYGAIEDEG